MPGSEGHAAQTVLRVSGLCIGAKDRKGKSTPIVDDISGQFDAATMLYAFGHVTCAF